MHSPTRLDCVVSNSNAYYFTGSLYVLHAIFGDDATCETVHSAFYIQFDDKDDDDDNSQQFTNRSLSKFDCIILDEVSMISFRHSCHILDMLNSLPIFPLTILCGNNRQLKAFAKQDSHIRTARNLFDNHLLLSFCLTTVLTEHMRCTDLQYNCLFLQYNCLSPLLETIYNSRSSHASHTGCHCTVLSAMSANHFPDFFQLCF